VSHPLSAEEIEIQAKARAIVDELMQINYQSPVHLTLALLPGIIERAAFKGRRVLGRRNRFQLGLVARAAYKQSTDKNEESPPICEAPAMHDTCPDRMIFGPREAQPHPGTRI